MEQSNRKGHIVLLNIFLVLIIASQFRVWWSGPFSSYLFFLTFIGLALVCLGAYGAIGWGKLGTVRKLLVLAEIGIGLAMIFEYEPIVDFLLGVGSRVAVIAATTSGNSVALTWSSKTEILLAISE